MSHKTLNVKDLEAYIQIPNRKTILESCRTDWWGAIQVGFWLLAAIFILCTMLWIDSLYGTSPFPYAKGLGVATGSSATLVVLMALAYGSYKLLANAGFRESALRLLVGLGKIIVFLATAASILWVGYEVMTHLVMPWSVSMAQAYLPPSPYQNFLLTKDGGAIPWWLGLSIFMLALGYVSFKHMHDNSGIGFLTFGWFFLVWPLFSLPSYLGMMKLWPTLGEVEQDIMVMLFTGISAIGLLMWLANVAAFRNEVINDSAGAYYNKQPDKDKLNYFNTRQQFEALIKEPLWVVPARLFVVIVCAPTVIVSTLFLWEVGLGFGGGYYFAIPLGLVGLFGSGIVCSIAVLHTLGCKATLRYHDPKAEDIA